MLEELSMRRVLIFDANIPEVYTRLFRQGVLSELVIVGSGSMQSHIEGYLLNLKYFDCKNL